MWVLAQVVLRSFHLLLVVLSSIGIGLRHRHLHRTLALRCFYVGANELAWSHRTKKRCRNVERLLGKHKGKSTAACICLLYMLKQWHETSMCVILSLFVLMMLMLNLCLHPAWCDKLSMQQSIHYLLRHYWACYTNVPLERLLAINSWIGH